MSIVEVHTYRPTPIYESHETWYDTKLAFAHAFSRGAPIYIITVDGVQISVASRMRPLLSSNPNRRPSVGAATECNERPIIVQPGYEGVGSYGEYPLTLLHQTLR